MFERGTKSPSPSTVAFQLQIRQSNYFVIEHIREEKAEGGKFEPLW